MLKRLDLQNIRTYPSEIIEFSEGLNVIAPAPDGPANDIGKSQIVRAIRWIVYNDFSITSTIRKGSKTGKAILEFDDGIIERFYDERGNGYVIGGQTFTGSHDALPPTLPEVTKMPLMVNDIPIQCSLASENRAFISLSPAKLEDAVSFLFRAQILRKASQLGRSEVTRSNPVIKQLEEELETLRAEAKSFEPLADCEKRFALLKQRSGQLSDILPQIQKAQELSDRSSQLSQKLAELKSWIGQIINLEQKCQRAAEVGQQLLQAIQLATQAQAIKKAQAESAKALTALTEEEKKVEKMLSNAGICPLCGQALAGYSGRP